MRYYIDGKDEDEDKAATLSSMLPKVENIVKSHMPHACKYSLYLAQRLYSALIYNVISSSLQFPALSIPIDFQ